MAISITNADASALSPADPPGNFRDQFVRITFDTSYPTGGYSLTPALCGMYYLNHVLTNGITEAGRGCVPIRQSDGTWKLKLYVTSTGAEVANAVDVSADRVIATVWGI